MLYSCPNHELSIEIIIQKNYARLSLNDRTMLDTSCVGSYMMKNIEFKWYLLERIKCNSEDWELDEGKGPGIKHKYERTFGPKCHGCVFFCSVLSNNSHLNSMVFMIKESVQELSSMERLLRASRA